MGIRSFADAVQQEELFLYALGFIARSCFIMADRCNYWHVAFAEHIFVCLHILLNVTLFEIFLNIFLFIR